MTDISVLDSLSEEAKHAWRDAHWEEDLQRAYDAGRKMADECVNTTSLLPKS